MTRPRLLPTLGIALISSLAAAALALAAPHVLGTATSTPAMSEGPTASSYMAAYVYACQPIEFDFAGVQLPIDPVATRIHSELFLAKYHGSCRDFYYAAVAPLLPGERQPYHFPADYPLSSLH